ncbi:MAG: iron-containing alcohol dehydrogenase [Sorangiineae bacterium]|nr:iron-containing alcohol dehydrogenase [Polyangiaceae bacterium]MEB2321544.1 iron-containing alcohol dehydrogenase [Sorangiineae bacterium]
MLSEATFELSPGVRTTFGAGSLAKLGKRVRALGAKGAFIVTDPGLVAHGVIAPVQGTLEASGVECRVFDGVTANPTARTVEEGAALARGRPSDVVIAVGGGSAMDAAKAIAIVGPNGGHITDYPFGCQPATPPQRVIALPTTAGTGSETNMYGVITEPALGRKILVGHPDLTPALVILDPLLTIDAPPGVTATCGMDVLTHAIEAFTCVRANPFSDSVALRAMSMVAAFLPRAFDDGGDVEARAQMLLAANLAGVAFTNSGLGLCHAMGHPLGARLGVSHGQALSTLLPAVMRFNLRVVAERYAQAAIALGVAEPGASDEENAARAIAAVEQLSARVGTARRGGELGIEPALIPTLVEDAFADSLMAATPRMPERADVRALYEGVL